MKGGKLAAVKSVVLILVLCLASVGSLMPLLLESVEAQPLWTIEWADLEWFTGKHTSIALDSSDRPHISYQDFYQWDSDYPDLKYAWWDGTDWNTETVDSTGDVGYYSSIALDSSDRPRICYYDATDGDLKYARWTGSAWSVQTVDSADDVGRYCSLALDSNDSPCISYLDDTNDDLKYARYNGANWIIETVDPGGQVGQFTSLALDLSDNPHISYHDWRNEDLKHARWNGSAWTIEVVDYIGRIGLYVSLALDSGGYPHIGYAYHVPLTFMDLKYAHFHLQGDIDYDGDVDDNDCLVFDAAYGTMEGDAAHNPDCDLDGDGDVDVNDLHIFAKNYGKSYP